MVLIGPSVQFKGRLPSMLMRAALRGVEPLASSDFLLPGLFGLDRQMKASFKAAPKVTYLSVLDAICPNDECPLTVGNDVPLTWDHGHLTGEASRQVANVLAPSILGRRMSEP